MYQNGVQAHIYSTESKAKKEEFTPPHESPLYTDDCAVRYVEALDGERFGVCVDVDSDVVRGDTGANAVRVTLIIDGGAVSKRLTIRLDNKGKPLSLKISDFSDIKHGQWQRHGLAFGSLVLGALFHLIRMPSL